MENDRQTEIGLKKVKENKLNGQIDGHRRTGRISDRQTDRQTDTDRQTSFQEGCKLIAIKLSSLGAWKLGSQVFTNVKLGRNSASSYAESFTPDFIDIRKSIKELKNSRKL